MTDTFIALLTCCMVGAAIAYAEGQRWPQTHVYSVYCVSGLFTAWLAVGPLYRSLIDIHMGPGSELALVVICAAGLYGVVHVAKRMVRQ